MSSRPNRKVKPSAVRARSRNRMLAVVGVIAIIVVLAVAIVMLSQNTPIAVNPTSTSTPTPSSTDTPSGSPTPYPTPLTSPAGQYSATGTRVLLQTSMGDIVVQMRDDKPITTSNFVNLVNQGVYDGTIFHRIIKDFMVQGGSNQSANVATIPDEIGSNNRNYVGTIAMAKTSQPNSATSQFFINVANNSEITYPDGTTFDGTYTVFGQVIAGMDVVMQMSRVPTTGTPTDQPLETITLIKAEVLP